MAIRVNLFKSSQEPFCRLLDEHGIEYANHSPSPGVPMASANWLTISEQIANASFWPSLAAVVVAWIRSKASREISVLPKDGRPEVITKNTSIEEVERLLSKSKSLTVFDTAKQSADDAQPGEE